MTCKFGKGCTFAHGVEELTAWNEHLKRMEKEVGKKSEEEKKKEQNKDGDSAAKSKVSSLIKDRRPVPTYKVGYRLLMFLFNLWNCFNQRGETQLL